MSNFRTKFCTKIIYYSASEITKIQSVANVCRKSSKIQQSTSHGTNPQWNWWAWCIFTWFIDIEFDLGRYAKREEFASLVKTRELPGIRMNKRESSVSRSKNERGGRPTEERKWIMEECGEKCAPLRLARATGFSHEFWNEGFRGCVRNNECINLTTVRWPRISRAARIYALKQMQAIFYL